VHFLFLLHYTHSTFSIGSHFSLFIPAYSQYIFCFYFQWIFRYRAKLIIIYTKSVGWSHHINFKEGYTELDLSIAGPNASPIPSSKDQPKHHPYCSYFRFDKFPNGDALLEAITFIIKQSLSGAMFIKA
jgi:hypothetical protein